MQIETFYHPPTFTLTYVVFDPSTKDAVVIDPVLDYTTLGSNTNTTSARYVLDFIRSRDLKLHYILETHAHADHLSGSQFLKRETGAAVAISENIKVVQETFKQVFNLAADFPTDGSQFDQLLKDGQTVKAGSLSIDVINTPGHTPACVTFKIEDALFTGDALFMPDFGTGRCDFPRGSAEDLYDSIMNKLYSLPDDTRVFVGHDYQPGGRALAYETTIGESKKSNKQLRGDMSKADFVKFRTERDKTLSAPVLLFQSVQINIDAGRMPKPAGNEQRYLHVPINLFRPADDVGDPT
jgi:glyoxylase-like metal-dependent hydrolase (beta-lactamase superfamily II)